MSLAIQPLSGWPSVNTAFMSSKIPNQIIPGAPGTSSTAGTPTVAAPYSYTLSTTFPYAGKYVYTPGSTTYVMGIIDYAGVVPARIFAANNGNGSYAGSTQPLPTLNYIIQNQVTASDGTTEYGGYVIVLTPAEPGPDSGSPSSPIVTKEGNSGASTGTGNYPVEPVLVQVPGYTTATPSGVYPQPEMVFYVSMGALLLTSTTQY
jgi:hypothetical protein